MSNLFATLGLPVRLDLDPADIDAAWRKLSQEHHPDVASGVVAETSDRAAQINQARQILSRPSGLLDEWLKVQSDGANRSHHTSISSSLMDLFSAVGSVLGAADQVIGKHQKAQSALAKSLLAGSAIAAQQGIQNQMGVLKEATEAVVAKFPEFEAEANLTAAERALAELKFLHKWEMECQQRLLDLISLD